MKTIITALSGLLLACTAALADPQIKSDGYVTFASVANPSGLSSLTPTQHGWSYFGQTGTVYFHHRFYGNGEDFRIRKLSVSSDPNGDGIYTAYTDVSALSTPGSGNPGYVLLKNGVPLTAVMNNTLCDEVIILNHSFLGRSFSGGVKWKLETDFQDVIQWTTHGPIQPFTNNISIQSYIGESRIITNAVIGKVVEYSYDLGTWNEYVTLTCGGVVVLPYTVVEPGKPKKFFRIRP